MRAIVNVGIGGDYPRRSLELERQCRKHCTDAAFMPWINCLPSGCPPHGLSHQYAFKLYAMGSAFSAGHNPVLWVDSTFRPRASIEKLWQEIESTGWYVAPQGDSVLGDWVTDRALGILGINRVLARSIPLVLSGLVGLDVCKPLGREIWDEWNQTYIAGAWNGPHKAGSGPIVHWGDKTEGFCSHDRGVQGHRHDEAALSWVLWKLRLKPKSMGFTVIDGNGDAPIERNW